jgi:electron transport complex protein RnfG
MSNVQYVQLEPRTHRSWHMYRALVGIGLICAIIIVSVFQLTLPAIKQNKLEFLQKSLYKIFPDAKQFTRYQYQSDNQFVQVAHDKEEDSVYAMYDAQHHLLGIAIPAKGMGYQDLIEILYGYQPEQQVINGYQILSSRETPGLGTRIETDKSFRNNFSSLDVTLNANGTALQHPVEVVSKGKKSQPWQVDTITGATISSRTMGIMISNSASQWIPKIQQQLKDFEP